MQLDLLQQSRVGKLIAGVDEVGRGPLCGPVVTAAVILDPQRPILGLNDSKKLTEKKREALFIEIQEKALAWCIGRADVEEIDQLNILQATMLAMQRAVAGLRLKPAKVLVDGNRLPPLDVLAEAIVSGDALVPAISAASVITGKISSISYMLDTSCSSSAVRSSPLRCASQGVPTPATAKAAVGTMPSSPATVAPKPNCAPSTSSRGVIEVTAVRRLNADSTMPASTSARPGRRAALAWGWVWRMSIGSGIRCMAAQGHR